MLKPLYKETNLRYKIRDLQRFGKLKKKFVSGRLALFVHKQFNN